VVGSGLDHDGLGRNLPGMHRFAETDMSEKIQHRALRPPGRRQGHAERIPDQGTYGLVHLSTGDLLRAEITAESPLGLKAKALMDARRTGAGRGRDRHDPQQARTNAPMPRASSSTASRARKAQAEALDGLLLAEVRAITAMLALEVPEEELVKRLLGAGRHQWPRRRPERGSDRQPHPRVRAEDRAAEGVLQPPKASSSPIHGTGSIAEITARLAQAIDG
jgi:adenylate kinase